jgi:single-stranded DNA-binding protein
MALSFNLTGRLVKEPEFSTFGDKDTPLARLRVASKREQRPDQTDFFDVTVFGDTAEALRGAGKGDPLTIVGEARQNVWTDSSDVTHYDVQFVANEAAHAPRRPPAASGGPARR